MKKKSNSPLEKISLLIKKASKKYKVAPYDVTSAQFWSVANGEIAEWQVRKAGGYTAIRGLEFPTPPDQNGILPRSAPRFPKYKAPRLENFTVHDSPVKELFRLAKLKDSDILRVVVQPDTHFPEHDPIATSAFKKFLEHYKPHGLINLGDFLEMESVSHWEPKSSKPRRLVPEIKAARVELGEIDKALGPQCIYKRFLIGNHEDWLEQLLITRVSEVYDGIEELGVGLRIQDLLGLKDLGYRVVPLNEILRLGEMHYIHGYYTHIHHAKKHLEVFGVNLMYGHVHDVQVHSGVSVKGVHEAGSIGCLRRLNASFLRGKPNNWSHALGVVEYRFDGTFTKYIPHIINGRFSFGGKIFDGNV